MFLIAVPLMLLQQVDKVSIIIIGFNHKRIFMKLFQTMALKLCKYVRRISALNFPAFCLRKEMKFKMSNVYL